MINYSNKLLVVALAVYISSCAVITPGEIGVKQRLGKLQSKPKTEGVVLINPFITKLVKIKTNTVNKEVKLNLPSKEGLNVNAEISILYHINQEKVIDLIKEVGIDYEKTLILSTFRSSAADVCARFYAKDMHSGMRSEIEKDIKEQMSMLLGERGIEIETVLLKSISLPSGLYAAIEAKLKAEQEAQQMEFILDRERKEAERKKIEAEGIRTAQKIIKEGITDENIKWKSLEVFKELSNSTNSKIIITDGKTPLLINDEKK